MKQYFDNDVTLLDKPKELKYNYFGHDLIFKTNSGMFSKDEIDLFSRKLLENIETQEYQKILDLGCGYGLLGISLAQRFNCEVYFVDITTRACEYTKINCQLNKINNYTIVQDDGIKNLNEEFDLIVINPPIHAGKKVVYRLYQESVEHLSATGQLYLVVHKKHGAQTTLVFLKTIAARVEVISKEKSLYIIRVKR